MTFGFTRNRVKLPYWGKTSGGSDRNDGRYEQGKAMPSVEKLEQLLKAIAPDQRIVWRIAAR
jgi:hypothetical protein